MIYLDYSATTPTNPAVLDVFTNASQSWFYNPNSNYPEAITVKNLIDEASEKIKTYLRIPGHEVIYTSGATEANNLAIKGVALKYQSLGNHLIMSPFEHSSVSACFGYLQKQGFRVDIVKTLSDGTVDLEDLNNLMSEETILVSICGVASELGIIQPFESIAKIVHQYPNAIFHSDMTQAIGKMPVKLESIDLISLSGHKIYGVKGIGALLKRDNIKLVPLLHGGKSTSKFRSGTPAYPLIASLEKAIDLALSALPKNEVYIRSLHQLLTEGLNMIEGVAINSPLGSLPHIVNISIMTMSSKDSQEYLAGQGIYVSTQTACSSDESRSETVYRLTLSETKARSSIRISLSHLTTKNEIESLLQAIAGLSL